MRRVSVRASASSRRSNIASSNSSSKSSTKSLRSFGTTHSRRNISFTKDAKPEVSKHSSGATVISVPSKTTFSSLSFVLKAGSRFTSHKTAGIVHVLKYFPFKSTERRLSIEVVREIEQHGGTLDTSIGRENFTISSQFFPHLLEQTADVLVDTLSPKFQEYELRDLQDPLHSEADGAESNAQSVVFETLYREAYKGGGLGLPLYVPSWNLHHINASNLVKFAGKYWKSNRLVVVGVGVDNAALNKSLDKAFKAQNPENDLGLKTDKDQPALYTGGEGRVPGYFTPGAHLALAFESTKRSDPHYLAFEVLEQILGGGARYGKEGPGNGLSSRLNTEIIDKLSWVDQAYAFNQSYSDTGLFGVYVSSGKGTINQVYSAVREQIDSLRHVSEAELQRAKNALKVDLLRKYQDRCELSSFLANQAFDGAQNLQTPEDVVAALDKISLDQVRHAASQLSSGRRQTVAAAGDVYDLTTYQ